MDRLPWITEVFWILMHRRTGGARYIQYIGAYIGMSLSITNILYTAVTSYI